MNLVWNSTLEGPSKRFALLALADRASDQGEITALGVPNLCRKTGISRSTMFRLLKELEIQDELIQRVQQYRGNQSRKASRFWINVPLLHASQRAGEDDRDQDEPVNPFAVHAGQTPVSDWDGAPSQSGTGPVSNRDGQGVSDRDGARPEDGPLSPSPPETSDPDPDPDGRTDEPASEDHDGGPHSEAAVRIRARMNLAKVGAQPAQVRKVESAVERLLDAGFAEAVVEQHAQRKLGEANTCKYLLNGLAPEHVVEAPGAAAAPPTAHSVPAWCGECDREGRDKPAMRRIEIDGVVRRCPNCHPDAVSQP